MRGGQPIVDGEAVLAREVRDDRVAVADRFAVVVDIGKLAARRGARSSLLYRPIRTIRRA